MMPNWYATIDCRFLRDDDLTVREKAEQLGVVLNRFIGQQERLGEQNQVDPDEFDEVMSEIYDWADFEQVWIKTL